jgi:tRNA(fMet)-specific endonuclease VapC
MSLCYLVDTNILSEPLKKHPHAEVVKRLLDNPEYVATAAPVIYEMVQGAELLPESKKRTRILRYLDDFVYPNVSVLPYDTQAAKLHGELQAQLISVGKTAPIIDGQIAAIAQLHRLIVVTRNTNDFENFSALTVENWFV